MSEVEGLPREVFAGRKQRSTTRCLAHESFLRASPPPDAAGGARLGYLGLAALVQPWRRWGGVLAAADWSRP